MFTFSELSTIPNGTKKSSSFTGSCGGDGERRRGSAASSRYSTMRDIESRAEKPPNDNTITAWQAGWNVTNAIQVSHLLIIQSTACNSYNDNDSLYTIYLYCIYLLNI